MRIAARTGDFEAQTFGPETGAPTLLLHGFPDTPSSFTPVAQLLAAAGRRVVAPWLRGYAPSPLSGPFTVDQLADDVLAIADALSPDRPVQLVGHDWGAIATYRASARAPERVARAVTLAVPHPSAFAYNVPRDPAQLRRSWYMLLFQLPHAAEWALRRRDFRLVERLWHDWSPGWSPPVSHLAEVKRCLAVSLPAPLEYYRSMLRALPVRPDHIRVPTLVLHGARDGCVGPALGEGQDRFFSGGYRREILEDVGHFLHLERPAAVVDRVTSWLS